MEDRLETGEEFEMDGATRPPYFGTEVGTPQTSPPVFTNPHHRRQGLNPGCQSACWSKTELEDSMADDIDRSTGKPAMAYVGEEPWHGLGEKLPEGASIEIWLKAARLEWRLNRLPVQYLVDGTLKTMEDRFVLVRSDTRAGLSIVSGDYQIVQPAEVLEFYRDLMTNYGYTLETAGALDGGRKVWALARTGVSDAADNQGVDEIAAYVLLATSCDKTLATTAAFTSVRVVCQNTLSFAMDDVKTGRRQHEKVPHNLKFDAEAVKERLGIMDQAWSEFLLRVRRMSEFPCSQELASAYFEHVL